jgi:hypothetical protein
MSDQETADRRAIKQVILNYAYCVDQRDGAGFAALFAPGAKLATSMGTHDTQEKLKAIPGQVGDYYKKTYHTLLNCMITVNGDKGTGVTYSAAHHLTPGGDGKYTDYIMYITYRDRFVKGPKGWQFEHRDVVLEFTQSVLVENVS